MSRRILSVTAVLAAGAALLSGSPPARAELRALVVGIDRYEHVSALTGAVADARDIAQALERVGARDLTLLLDGQADRASLERAWAGLMDRTLPGDQLVFTYAGHGSQAEAGEGGGADEDDQRDEFLVLPGFAPEGDLTRERLDDNVLNAWFKQAGAKGARVLALVDACHSGTAFRKLDKRAPKVTYRFAQIPIDTELLEIPMPPEAKGVEQEDLPNLTWVAGAQDHQTVPEMAMQGAKGALEPRGVTSWSLARALEGEADQNRDGTLSRGELYDFVEGKVRQHAEGLQTPNFWPLTTRDAPLVPVPDRAAAPAGAAADPAALLAEPVRLRVLAGADTSLAPMLAGSLVRARLVEDRGEAELIWDAQRRDVISPLGDIVAENVAASGIQQILDKQLVLRLLKLSPGGGLLRTRVLPDDRTHRAGEEVAFSIEGEGLTHLTLANLANDGTVQLLFPIKGDPPTVASPYELGPVHVSAPFGADHLVAVATPDEPAELRALLARIDQKPAALEFGRTLAGLIGQPGVRIGLQGVFTAAK